MKARMTLLPAASVGGSSRSRHGWKDRKGSVLSSLREERHGLARARSRYPVLRAAAHISAIFRLSQGSQRQTG
ncbi:hypothetical protein C7120_04275 [Prevotella sp. oral taxon 376]|nr:hypothetical protein C7120_04275 [Prevotella sp. oral taxon 376]